MQASSARSAPAARRAPGIRSLKAGGRFPTRPYHHTGRLPGKQQPQRFECLALALALSTGQGGGAFTSNFMDVTGKVTSLSVSGGGAAVRGTATVTGLGAGPGRPLHGESHR